MTNETNDKSAKKTIGKKTIVKKGIEEQAENKIKRKKIEYEAMEPRLLLSADVGVLVDGGDDDAYGDGGD